MFHRDGLTVSLSGALRHGDGVHVETIASRPLTDGTFWLVEWFTALRQGKPRYASAAQIGVFGKAGSSALAADLIEAGVPKSAVVVATSDNAITAATMLREAVVRGTVSHLVDPDVLDASVAASREHRSVTSGGWVFVPKTKDDDSTPVESASLAHWLAKTTKRRPGRKSVGRVLR
ncbi:hypothetical protein [Paraoerskovia sediminicola]|uniref:hypothetical protein n=1 Tax=Paraoerskovia sediminicola TaxID=1138587 RepID=UPI00257244D0|nr:hypothetical protein [Paraoerskovia sediminicola]